MKFFNKKTTLFLLLIVLVSLPIILPFFHKGFFPTHDGEWAVVRLADMYREVRDGQIPPRFSGNLNFGYGYPLFQYAYPMPYLLGLPTFLMHFGLVNSIKLLFAFSVPLSGIAMFFAAREMWKSDDGGLISSLLYMYLPYRMVDLYVRGSLGESIASITFPIILFCLKRLSQKQSVFSMLILAISFATLILSHNIMAVLFGIILFAYFIFLLRQEKKINTAQIILGLLLGVGISAFFWLPALLEKNLILLSKIPIADRDLYYVTVSKFLFSPFGYGTPTESNPFTYQIGIPQITIGIVACYVSLRAVLTRKKEHSEVILFTLLSLFFIFMMLPISKMIWSNVPLLKEINFPWTSLFPLGLLLSLLGGKIFIASKQYFIIGVFLCLFAIVFTLPYARPSTYVDRGDGFYFTNDATTTSSSELMPLSVKSFPISRPQEKIEIIKGKGTVSVLEDKSQKKVLSVNLTTPSTVRLNTIYFPGWHWYREDKEVAIRYDNPQGTMEAILPEGNYTVRALFQNTIVRTLANSVSALFILLTLAAFLVRIVKPYSLASIRNRYHS
jgi:hypothetical protein